MSRFICIEEPNGADALQLRNRETPKAGPGEILIKQTKLGFKLYRYLSNNRIVSFS